MQAKLQTYAGRALAVLMTAAIGIQLAWWGWHFFTPASTPTAAVSAGVDPATADQLFGDAPRDAAAAPETAAPATPAEARSDEIRLKGVFAVDGRTLSAAVVNIGGRDLSVRLGEKIDGGTSLAEVHADHIVVVRSGTRRRLDLERTAAPLRGGTPPPAAGNAAEHFRLNVAPAGSNRYTLSRNELNNVLQDPQQLSYLGRIGPGPAGGVQVQDAGAGTLAQKLGLQPGDIITQINGQPVASPGDLARLYGQFNTLSQVRAEVRRNGVPLSLSYTINP